MNSQIQNGAVASAVFLAWYPKRVLIEESLQRVPHGALRYARIAIEMAIMMSSRPVVIRLQRGLRHFNAIGHQACISNGRAAHMHRRLRHSAARAHANARMGCIGTSAVEVRMQVLGNGRLSNVHKAI